MKKLLLTSKTASTLGTTFFNAIIDLWVVTAFGSAKVLGNTLAFTTLAAALCSFFGGYISDSRYRFHTLIGTNLLSMIICVLATFDTNVFSRTPALVYVTVFCLNIANYLSSPLFKTLTALVISKDEIVSFNKIMTLFTQIFSVFIPPIAAFLFQKHLVTISSALLLNALSFAICVVFLIPVHGGANTSKVFAHHGYIDTLHMIQHNRILIFFNLSGFLLNFFLSGLNVWLPFFSVKILQNASLYGIAISSEAVGGIFGALSIQYIKLKTNLKFERITLLVSGMLLFSLVLKSNTITILVAVFLMAAAASRYNIALQSVIQLHVDTEYIGKTFSVAYLVSNLALPIASYIFGVILNYSWEVLLGIVSIGLASINLLWYFLKENFEESQLS